MNPPRLSTDEAAEALSIHPDTVRKLVAEGQITGYRPNGRDLRFRPEDLEAYLATTRTGAPVAVPDLVPPAPKPRRLRPMTEGVDDVRIDPRLVTYRGRRRA